LTGDGGSIRGERSGAREDPARVRELPDEIDGGETGWSVGAVGAEPVGPGRTVRDRAVLNHDAGGPSERPA
jgi:hypothetical protein